MDNDSRGLKAVDVPTIPVPDDISGYELVDGQLVPVMPSKRRHSWLSAQLTVRLFRYVEDVGMGAVYPDVWCRLKLAKDPERLRAPDVAYFGNAKLTEAGEGDIFPFPPDLAVEIHSPTNLKRLGDFQLRLRDYVDAGTPLLWVIYPDAGYAMVHRPDGSARMIRESEALDGEEVLPGLRIELRDLFRGMP
jgi:Uma2 family endonuclease